MTEQEIAAELTSLAQLDVDAVLAYDRAISTIREGQVARELSRFKVDHERHILDISEALLAMGRNAPQLRPDLKGSILGSVTGIWSRLGTERALQAMRTNEQLTTSTYARALAKPFPEHVLAIIRRGDADERRHLAWIERALDQRLWEGEQAHPS
jgi:Domain of unknown function (DUF2383)